MASKSAAPRDGAARRPVGAFVASIVLSYVLVAGLIATLVDKAGVWNVLANTRLLDFAIEIGIVRYHDLHMGVVDGIPDLKHYVMAQDPIDYRLLLLAVAVYFVYWIVRAWKFHLIMRWVGSEGSPRAHMRARLYGLGLARFIPFRFGDAATEDALVAQGVDERRVRQAFSTVELLTVVFQIGLFWAIGLWLTDYSVWMSQSVWAVIILAVAYLIARGARQVTWGPRGFRRSFGDTWRGLADDPRQMARLGGISALVMLIDDLTPFIIAMAFTSDNVIMSVPFIVIQSAVVSGYIASRFQITPLGIGLWEWAFALTLYASGVGFPEAATIALLDSAVRNGTGLITFLVVRFGPGVPTSIDRVAERYFAGTGAPSMEEPPATAPPADIAIGAAS